ncbi:MAG: helix-turn-helix transcriptional regulator [Alphaproteobacteria bacterium]|nr:helix-turn-helix transcriptional regulator [Alphaproteobacteria bacterium]
MLSNLLIELYRAAQGMAVDEFQEYSMGLLNSLVPFDSAIYGSGVLKQQGLQIHECFLHNQPVEVISDYAAITHADPVLRAARANPDRVIRFHPPTLFSGKESWPLFDYAKRYEHSDGMSTVHIDQDAPHSQILSMWRADKDSHFLKQDGWIAEQVLPHFLEALKINQALAIHRSVKDTDRSTAAIARQNGTLHFCSMGFRKLVNMEWPDWEGAILPDPLMDELARIGSTGFCTATIRVSVKCIGELLFLKASRVSASVSCPAIRPALLQKTYGLTPAEARVAIVLLEGISARDVADYLSVSHHTVRTQLKQIYAKLGVDTRARFVKLLLGLAQ